MVPVFVEVLVNSVFASSVAGETGGWVGFTRLTGLRTSVAGSVLAVATIRANNPALIIEKEWSRSIRVARSAGGIVRTRLALVVTVPAQAVAVAEIAVIALLHTGVRALVQVVEQVLLGLFRRETFATKVLVCRAAILAGSVT